MSGEHTGGQPKKINSLDQFQLCLFASKDTRLTACDLAVLAEITDRFIKDDGVTRATGVTHLVRETGRNSKAIKASRKRLLQHHYLQVGANFQGATGTAYIPNFAWSIAAADAVRNEVASRKKIRRSRKRSGGLPTPTKKENLVGASTPPQSALVGASAPPLRELVGVPGTPQTYVSPTGELRGGVHTPVNGLLPVPGVPPVEWKIVDSSVDGEAGEKWLNLKLKNNAGDLDEAGICLESNDPSRQADGQKALARLTSLMDEGIEGSEDLHGLWVVFDAQCEIQLAPA